MSVFINDTLQQQIERGEVWTQSLQFSLGSGLNTDIAIQPDSNRVSFLLDVFTEAQLKIEIRENITITAAGATLAPINMDRDGSYSTSVVMQGAVVAYTGGTSILTATIPGGLSGSLSQFSGEAGLIVKANTDYHYEFTNQSNNKADVSISYYFREL